MTNISSTLVSPEKLGNSLLNKKKKKNEGTIIGWDCEICSFKNHNLRKYCELCTCPRLNLHQRSSETAEEIDIQHPYGDYPTSEYLRICEEKWKQLKLQGWREEPTKNIWKNPNHDKIYVSPNGPAPLQNDYSNAKYGIDFFWNLEEVIDYVKSKNGTDGFSVIYESPQFLGASTFSPSLLRSTAINTSSFKVDETPELSTELVSFKNLINNSEALGSRILSKKISSQFPNDSELLLSNYSNSTTFDASSILSIDHEAITLAVGRIKEDVVNVHEPQGPENIKNKYNSSQDTSTFLDTDNERNVRNESPVAINNLASSNFNVSDSHVSNNTPLVDLHNMNDQSTTNYHNENNPMLFDKPESPEIISSANPTSGNLQQDKSCTMGANHNFSAVDNADGMSNPNPVETECNAPNSLQQKYGVKLTAGMPVNNRKSLFSLALKYDLTEKSTSNTIDFISGPGNSIAAGSSGGGGSVGVGPDFTKMKSTSGNNHFSAVSRDNDGYSVRPPPPQTTPKEYHGDKLKRINRHQSTMPFPPMFSSKQPMDTPKGHMVHSLPQPLPINDSRLNGYPSNNIPIPRNAANLIPNPPSSCVSTTSNSLMHLDHFKKTLFQKHWKVLQEAGWQKLPIDNQQVNAPHYGYGYVCPYGQAYWYSEYFSSLTRGIHYYLNEDELIHNVEYQCGEIAKKYPHLTPHDAYQYASQNFPNSSSTAKRLLNNDPYYHNAPPQHQATSKYVNASNYGGNPIAPINQKQQQQQQQQQDYTYESNSYRQQHPYSRELISVDSAHSKEGNALNNNNIPVVLLSSDSSESLSSQRGSEGYISDDHNIESTGRSGRQTSPSTILSQETTSEAVPSHNVVKGKVPVTVTDAVIREIKQKSGSAIAAAAAIGGLDGNDMPHKMGRPLGSLNRKPAVGRRSSARPTRRPATFTDNSDCILDEYEEIGLKAEDVESGKISFQCLTQRLAWKGDGFTFKSSAHPFIGKMVRLQFLYYSDVDAICVCYLPQRGRRGQLWGVEHIVEVDFEDLSFEEMEIGIKSYNDAMATASEVEKNSSKKRNSASTYPAIHESSQPQRKRMSSSLAADRLDTNTSTNSSQQVPQKKKKKVVSHEEDIASAEDNDIVVEEGSDTDNRPSREEEVALAVDKALEDAATDHQVELTALASRMTWEMEMALERQKAELIAEFQNRNDDNDNDIETDRRSPNPAPQYVSNNLTIRNNLPASSETSKSNYDSLPAPPPPAAAAAGPVEMNTLDDGRAIELWSEFVQVIHEARPDRRKSGDKRELVEIERGDDYPVRVTVKVFKQRNTTDSMSAFLRVLFKHAEQTHLRATNRKLPNSAAEKKTAQLQSTTGSGRSSRTQKGKIQPTAPPPPVAASFRTIFVAEDAEDAGGLIRQWLNDYLAELKNYTVVTTAILGPSKKLSTFRVFTSGGGVFLPSRLVVPKSDDQPIDLESVSADKDVEKQRQELYDLYRSTGKVYNQMLRESIPLPEAFASPLLIYYLRKGENGLSESTLRAHEIKQAILDFDIDYTGALNDIGNDGDEEAYRRALCTFVKDCIYSPRTGPLSAMKSGFEIVSIISHLDIFSWKQFQYFFVGRDVITPSDILNITKFSDNCTETFRRVFLHTVNIMTPEDARKLVRFCSGAPYLAFDTLINITMKPVAKVSNLPLATAFSCTTQLFVPFNERFTSPETLLENLRNSFRWGEESEFHDTSVAPVVVVTSASSSSAASATSDSLTTSGQIDSNASKESSSVLPRASTTVTASNSNSNNNSRRTARAAASRNDNDDDNESAN